MGQVESIGEFRFDPDEWEQERSTGNFRPRRRSADARPFLRPRSPLQFGTVPTALPVNPADYVDPDVRKRLADLDDWDAKLGTEEYVPPEHTNVVGINPLEEAQRLEERYEEYLDHLFPRRKELWNTKDATVASSSSTRHAEVDPSAAKPTASRTQAELANTRSRRHMLERGSNDNITFKPSLRREPPSGSVNYDEILNKAFPKRRAQMEQRHQRQQQQLQKLPDPPKPPAYRNPNIRPNIKRSASASLPPPTTGFRPTVQPIITGSSTKQSNRCQCPKCSGNPASTELHKPPTTGINFPNISTTPGPSTAIPGQGRITVDMHLRVHMDLPTSTSSTTMQAPHPMSYSHQSPSSFQNYPHELPRDTSYTSGQQFSPEHQQSPTSQSNMPFNTPAPISDYYNTEQHHQSRYYHPQPHLQQDQPRPHSQPYQSQQTFHYHPQSQYQLSFLELQQLQAAHARAHLIPLQTRYGSIGTSPGGYTVSPSPNTPLSGAVPGYGQQKRQRPSVGGSVSRVDSMHMEEEGEDDDEDEEEEEEDDDDDPYHDKRYGGV